MSLRPNTNLYAPTMNEDTFNTLETIHKNQSADDTTVIAGNKNIATRLQIMVSTSSTENSTEALLMATRNLMSALKNKIAGIKFIKWNEESANPKGYDKIPKSIEKAEEFIHNFSRFSKSQKGYYRIQIVHDDSISREEIVAQARLFNIQKKQFLAIADSQATTPVTIGLVLGTTEEMVVSPDFLSIIKKESEVEEIGLTWKYIQTGQKGKYNNNQKAIYVETESKHATKLQTFLQKSFNDGQIQMFGCSLTFLPSNAYPTKSQQTKIKKFAPAQSCLVDAIRSTQLEVAIFKTVTFKDENDKEISISLAKALANLQSITIKQGVSKNKILSFYGNLFYAIIPDQETNVTTFQYLVSNEDEAESVLNALPLFLKEHYNLDQETSKSYSRSKDISKALNGNWNYETRIFRSKRDMKEEVFLENLQLLTQSNNEQHETNNKQVVYIDPDHQRMMSGKAIDNDSICTNLHQQDKETENVNKQQNQQQPMETDEQNDNYDNNENNDAYHKNKEATSINTSTSSLTSVNTGSTKSSKAKRYAEEATKEITHQMLLKQQEHEKTLRERDARMEELERRLQQVIAGQSKTTKQNVINIDDNNTSPSDDEMPEADEYASQLDTHHMKYHEVNDDDKEDETEGTSEEEEEEDNENRDDNDEDMSTDENEEDKRQDEKHFTNKLTPLQDEDDQDELRSDTEDSDSDLSDFVPRNKAWDKEWKHKQLQLDQQQTTNNLESIEKAPGAKSPKRKSTRQRNITNHKKTAAGSTRGGQSW